MRKVWVIMFVNIWGMLFIPVVFADSSCPYQSEFDRCMSANQAGINRSITDFVCISSFDPSEVMYNIVLDKKFKDIDKDIQNECSTLENSKDYYFWANQQENFLRGIDKIERNFSDYGPYWTRYNELCNQQNPDGILQTTIKCLWGSTPFANTSDFFLQSTCTGLIENKLDIDKAILYNTMKLNKMAVRRDDKKTFFKSRRQRYSDLLDILTFNIDYIDKIASKWNAKIKDNCY